MRVERTRKIKRLRGGKTKETKPSQSRYMLTKHTNKNEPIKAKRPKREQNVSQPTPQPLPPPVPAPSPAPVELPPVPPPALVAEAPAPIRAAPPVSQVITDEDRVRAAKKVISIVTDTEVVEPTIINPNSKFVITTYWWGRGNVNGNTRHPCIAYENEERKELRNEISQYDYIKKIEDVGEQESEIRAEIEAGLKAAREKKIKNMQDTFKISREEAEDRLFRLIPAIRYEEMIQRFQDDCKKANCNYLTMEYPFERQLYQAAINGKPAFIRKVIERCKGKGPNGTDLAVVYIDGDMRPNVYPKLFDIDGVDFMARGWNIDPRANQLYLKNQVCFDPYIFETSGGIQYFANTPASLDLLDTWELSNISNPGKADDRVISIAFNVFKYQCNLAYIQLPIEYLWLTDNYLFQKPENTSVQKAIIEHPECLTAEDAAAGAAASRTPDFYTEIVQNAVQCERLGGKFYEYIYFPSKDMVETLGPYLDYMSNAKNKEGEFMFEVIPFDKQYGRHQEIAERNIEKSKSETETPTSFDIPKILAQLEKGNDVTIGSDPRIEDLKNEPLEFIAYNKESLVGGDTVYPDLKPKFDMSKPMFFSAKNKMLYHILAMCESPEDLTSRFNESYTFLARIRCFWLR